MGDLLGVTTGIYRLMSAERDSWLIVYRILTSSRPKVSRWKCHLDHSSVFPMRIVIKPNFGQRTGTVVAGKSFKFPIENSIFELLTSFNLKQQSLENSTVLSRLKGLEACPLSLLKLFWFRKHGTWAYSLNAQATLKERTQNLMHTERKLEENWRRRWAIEIWIEDTLNMQNR